MKKKSKRLGESGVIPANSRSQTFDRLSHITNIKSVFKCKHLIAL